MKKLNIVLFAGLLFLLVLTLYPKFSAKGENPEEKLSIQTPEESAKKDSSDPEDPGFINSCTDTDCLIKTWADSLIHRDTTKRCALLTGVARQEFVEEHCLDDQCRQVNNGIGYCDLKMQNYTSEDLGQGLIKINYSVQDFDAIEREFSEYIKTEKILDQIYVTKYSVAYHSWLEVHETAGGYQFLLDELTENIKTCNFVGISDFYKDFHYVENDQIRCMQAPTEELTVGLLEFDAVENISYLKLSLQDQSWTLKVTFDQAGPQWSIDDIQLND